MEENNEVSYLKMLDVKRQETLDMLKKIIDMEIDLNTFPKELEEMPDSVFFTKLDELIDGSLFFSPPSHKDNLFDYLAVNDSAILAQPKVFLIEKYHLRERCRCLNVNFSLNEDNKKKILRLDEMFITAYNEAIKEALGAIDIFKNKGLIDFTVLTKLIQHIDKIDGSAVSRKTV
jgi:hypothetical protein